MARDVEGAQQMAVRSRPETSCSEKLRHEAVHPPKMASERLRGPEDVALLGRQEEGKSPPWWETPPKYEC